MYILKVLWNKIIDYKRKKYYLILEFKNYCYYYFNDKKKSYVKNF